MGGTVSETRLISFNVQSAFGPLEGSISYNVEDFPINVSYIMRFTHQMAEAHTVADLMAFSSYLEYFFFFFFLQESVFFPPQHREICPYQAHVIEVT